MRKWEDAEGRHLRPCAVLAGQRCAPSADLACTKRVMQQQWGSVCLGFCRLVFALVSLQLERSGKREKALELT